eukprot:jgi/Botrbrau1/23411/Bobra.0051s0055.1
MAYKQALRPASFFTAVRSCSQPRTIFASARLDQSEGTHDPESAKSELSDSVVRRVLRANLVAEGTMYQMVCGQSLTAGQRPDIRYYKDKEAELLEELKQVAPYYRTRPSILGPLSSVAGFGVGALSACLPPKLQLAVTAGLQDALQEEYNDQLRDLAVSQDPRVKDLVKHLRDADRLPTGGAKVPNLASLQDLSLPEGIAAAAKASLKGLFRLAERL